MDERRRTKVMGIIFVMFASALTVVAQAANWQQYQRLQRNFQEGYF
jgi:DNA-binding transcriptional regulator of glucitol operon